MSCVEDYVALVTESGLLCLIKERKLKLAFRF